MPLYLALLLFHILKERITNVTELEIVSKQVVSLSSKYLVMYGVVMRFVWSWPAPPSPCWSKSIWASSSGCSISSMLSSSSTSSKSSPTLNKKNLPWCEIYVIGQTWKRATTCLTVLQIWLTHLARSHRQPWLLKRVKTLQVKPGKQISKICTPKEKEMP